MPRLLLAATAGALAHGILEALRLATRHAQGWSPAEVAPTFVAEVVLAGVVGGVVLAIPAWRGLPRGRLVGVAVAVAIVGEVLTSAWIPAERSDLPRVASPAERRTIVLITGDTLRRDHVSAYADARIPGLTPHLERLAAEGLLFDDAVTVAPLTLPAHATLLSGVHPADHRVVRNGRTLPADLEGVPADLAAAGFRAAGFPSAVVLHGSHGLRRWFHVYRDDIGGWPAARHLPLVRLVGVVGDRWVGGRRGAERGDRTVARALAWLDRVPADASVFLWVHLYDAHTPHDPAVGEVAGADLPHPCDYGAHPAAIRRGVRTIFRADEAPLPADADCRARDWSALERSTRTYAAEVRFLDEQVGALIAGLEARGRWAEAGVVFVADHGESLTEHQHHVSHQHALYDPVLRVPLIVKAPGVAPGRVDAPVSTVRVAATLRALAGLPPDPGIVGPDLREPADGLPIAVGPAPIGGVDDAPIQAAARRDGHKVLRDVSGHVERYALADDPGERRSLVTAEEQARDAEALRRWLERPAIGGLVRLAPIHEAARDALAQPGVLGSRVDADGIAPFAPLDQALRDVVDRWQASGGERADEVPDALRAELEALGYVD